MDFSKNEIISSKKIISIIKDKFLERKIYDVEKVFNIAVRQPQHFFNKDTLVLEDFPANFINFEKLDVKFKDIGEIILSESPGEKNSQKEDFLRLIRPNTVVVDLRHRWDDYEENDFDYAYCPQKEGVSEMYGWNTVKCEKIDEISEKISIFYLNVKNECENYEYKFRRIHFKKWKDGELIEAARTGKIDRSYKHCFQRCF